MQTMKEIGLPAGLLRADILVGSAAAYCAAVTALRDAGHELEYSDSAPAYLLGRPCYVCYSAQELAEYVAACHRLSARVYVLPEPNDDSTD